MENNLVRIEDESGNSFDMIILKEFEYKKEKYAVLMEDVSCTCDCDDKDCSKECKCHDECDCADQCDSHNACDCGCNDEPMLALLHIVKDKDGNEIFKSVDDEELFDELIKEADKVLYE